MHIFHKWGRWQAPKETKMMRVTTIGISKLEVSRQPFVRISQVRHCEKCGLYQERILSEIREES